MPFRQQTQSISQPDLTGRIDFNELSGDSNRPGGLYSPSAPPPSANTSGFVQSSTLRRRHSTAQNLIQRYNSLDTTAHSQPALTRNSPTRFSLDAPSSSLLALPTASVSMSAESPLSVTDTSQLPVLRTSYSETQFSDQNALRGSLKSFFGALGWKREPEFKAIRYRPRDVIPETESERSTVETSSAATATISDPQSISENLPQPNPEHHSTNPQTEDKAEVVPQLLPYDESPRKTGLLQYLQPDSAWSPSLVTLTDIRLRVELQLTGQGGALELPLAQCIDVRSLSSKETKELLIAAPFNEGDAVYLLELEFQTNRLERFAAQSITERGAWVSALW